MLISIDTEYSFDKLQSLDVEKKKNRQLNNVRIKRDKLSVDTHKHT